MGRVLVKGVIQTSLCEKCGGDSHVGCKLYNVPMAQCPEKHGA